MDVDGALQLITKNELLGQFRTERDRLDRIDKWLRWDHEAPYIPKQSTKEYQELSARAITPWLDLVVTSVVQNLYVEGYRRPSDKDQASGWARWQANGMDARQIPLHRAAVAYGAANMTVLPGKMPLTGEPMAIMRGVSPRRMLPFYIDVAGDEWPYCAIQIDRRKGGGYTVKLLDETSIFTFECDDSWGNLKPVGDVEVHGVGVCPVVRFCNKIDLEGRTDGEVEPYISTAGRIDQTTFDRLVVQRFSSWVVRTIAGLSINETVAATGESAQATKLRLKVEDLLVAEDADTKFGSLPATPLNGFIEAHESDVKALAAVSQTPAHELLGSMANLSAEALAAAKASQTAKVDERKHTLGEEHEKALRLGAHIMGDADGASDYEAQVRWKDTEIRSLAQAADALGKLATMLQLPVEMLWEKVPGFTDQDVARAKILFQEQGGMAEILRKLVDAQTPAPIPAA